ncbi:serine/threonine-protein kinase [Streptomyces thermoalcalitolerans]|uniref:serine/threonine-protein kinase n=1 Tax=Streptomyces thermoalcalitolerans TaxID=65605 RepID=UPI0031E12981
MALKVLRARLARDPDFLARFRREVSAARKVDSPFVVPLVDADTETAEPWLATAFVPGPTLADVIRASGPLTEDRLRELGRALAGALRDIHAAGLVHRDLKPSNVLLHPDKGAQVIDLGIARALDGTRLTATGLVVGSAGYMAPEQLTGGGGSPASDVFALGAVLAYAATGRHPFGGGPAHRVGHRTLTEEPDLDGVPDALLPLLASCLAKDPAQRPAPRRIREALTGSPQQPARRGPDGPGDAAGPGTVALRTGARPGPAAPPLFPGRFRVHVRTRARPGPPARPRPGPARRRSPGRPSRGHPDRGPSGAARRGHPVRRRRCREPGGGPAVALGPRARRTGQRPRPGRSPGRLVALLTPSSARRTTRRSTRRRRRTARATPRRRGSPTVCSPASDAALSRDCPPTRAGSCGH